MEEKNELSDIMLDKKDDGQTKKRKILLFTVLLLVIFLLVLAGMKIFNKPENKKNNFNIVLPPEPASKTENDTSKDELFKQVPIIEENNTQEKNNFNAMVEKLKNKEQQNKTAKPVQEVVPAKIPKEQTDAKIIKKNIVSPVKKNIAKKSSALKKRSIYIQVGVTFTTKPSKKYLSKIKKEGYTYKLYRTKISNKYATKILLGPYKSRSEAKRELQKVKKRVNKAAFIYVIK